jgi:hypothetical protein
MELTMASRRAITKAQAVRHRSGSRTVKAEILDVVCAVTGFSRDCARRALKAALTPRVVKPRTRRRPKYDAAAGRLLYVATMVCRCLFRASRDVV